jgi:hypothetical protein
MREGCVEGGIRKKEGERFDYLRDNRQG